MRDQDLALALRQATTIAAEARRYWETLQGDELPERDRALVVFRNASALARDLERWIGARACAALQLKAG